MKKIENKKLETTLALILETIEFLIFILFANCILKIKINYILIILFTYFIVRLLIKMIGGINGHYKIVNYFDSGWRQCVLFTFLFLISLFITSTISIEVGVLSTIFCTLITSNIANIDELTQGKKSSYREVYFWCRRNRENSQLKKFEKQLEKDEILYKIYMDLFIGGLTQEEVAFNLGYEYITYLEKPINRLIGRLEASIFEIYELTKFNR